MSPEDEARAATDPLVRWAEAFDVLVAAPMRAYQEAFETALAVAAHERIADKTGRRGFNPTSAMRRIAEPDGYALPPDVNQIPAEFAEWCWPL